MSLSPPQKRTLSALLDELVPPSPDGRLPGAGELGLADFVEERLREQPALRPALLEGLARLDEGAASRAGLGFAELDAPERRAVREAALEQLPGFLAPLVLLTYLGYYRHPRVLEALGLEARPPYPEGYAVPPTDFSLLDPVREKAPFYRRP